MSLFPVFDCHLHGSSYGAWCRTCAEESKAKREAEEEMPLRLVSMSDIVHNHDKGLVIFFNRNANVVERQNLWSAIRDAVAQASTGESAELPAGPRPAVPITSDQPAK